MRTSVVLKSLIKTSKDGEWGKANPFNGSIKMYVIRGTDFKNVREGDLSNLPIRYIPRRFAAYKSLQPNDILLETAGGSKNRPTGRTLFIKQSLIDRSTIPFTCASFARFIRIDPTKANPRYVFWYLQYIYEAGFMHQYHIQHTGVARFQYTDFSENEKLYLPPLSTQNKISRILSAYDDLIENNAQRIRILEKIAWTIYHKWFVHFDLPNQQERRMIDSPQGLIPVGWNVTTVGEAFDIIGGGTPSTKVEDYWIEGDIDWYTPSDLTVRPSMFIAHSSRKITKLGLQKSSAKLFPAKSVMMTSRATIGYVAINTTPACTNQGFITCLPNDNVSLYHLYFWLRDNTQKFINLGSGTTYKEITKSVFKTIKLLLPPKDISRQFTQIIDPLANLVLNLQRRNSNLRKSCDLLLPTLISGEIAVSGLDVRISSLKSDKSDTQNST